VNERALWLLFRSIEDDDEKFTFTNTYSSVKNSLCVQLGEAIIIIIIGEFLYFSNFLFPTTRVICSLEEELHLEVVCLQFTQHFLEISLDGLWAASYSIPYSVKWSCSKFFIINALRRCSLLFTVHCETEEIFTFSYCARDAFNIFFLCFSSSPHTRLIRYPM
jgi:hypothetical protein